MNSFRIHVQAVRDLLGRYAAAFRHAWRHRRETDPPARLPHEAQFLPAALALQESPVSPAPRVAIWLLIAFAGTALGWAVLGRIDVVTTAEGKIIPNQGSKVVQPVETATVKAIHVRDGQRVKAGDLLIELDATVAAADSARVESDLLGARLQAARAEAFVARLRGEAGALRAGAGIPEARVAQEQRLLDSEWMEHRARLERAEAEMVRRQAELRGVREMVRKLEHTVPLARQRAEDIRRLADQELESRHAYMAHEQARLEQEGELATQREREQELAAALAEAGKLRAGLAAEAQRSALDRLREAQQQISAQGQELAKARQRGRLMKLRAPVDGSVQQLAVHTLGGVVTPAQPLLVVVPDDNSVQVEAFVENKDVGFVAGGQNAEVKVQTFPYTKYGTLNARVLHVSNDAIEDERRGLVYSARVQMDRSWMRVGERRVNLTPGMAVTVEIKIGRRRVIEYFLGPLMEYQRESLRER
ncbi:MAG TPA: HlyD family type I secretion periplasmic adaptor subunit [Longimicrobium sp.]|uniref:HlyD family type I secretion periplasmic adaptor subunit n=1 Tax=Longimicrobium sp. TaxID=2029185 RepID=UPI002EDA6CEA